jgi:hypothetical protein
LVKTDSNGNQEWNHFFGDASDQEVCYSVVQATDGGYILAGGATSSGPNGADYWMLKTDTDGDSLWSRSFGGSGFDECYSILQTNDGGYVLAGHTDSFGAGLDDFWLVKTGPEHGTTVCGDVSGVWDSTGSPYYVNCDVNVPAGQTLTIQPGVQVLFTGHYKFNVYGNLRAIGADQDSIVFTRAFPTEESRWWGIRFADEAGDSSRLAHCVVEYGTANGAYPENAGGGIFIDRCALSVEHCSIRHNDASDGGGVAVFGDCTPTFSRCEIAYNNASNTVGSGGAIMHQPRPTNGGTITLDHCLLHDNSAAGGGAIWPGRSNFILTNCAISKNTASQQGGAINLWHSNGYGVTLLNCISWENAAPSDSELYYGEAAGSAIVSYSNMQDVYPGSGNIDTDPLFVDATNGNFHLTYPSPCVDAGDPTSPLDPDGSRADMGAFYFAQQPLLLVSPLEINFGLQDIGADSVAIVAMTNESGLPVIVNEVSHSESAFVVDTSGLNGQVNPHSTYNLNVTFAPSVPGSYYDELVIVAQRAGDDTLVIPMHGEAAIIPVAPESLVVKRGTGNNVNLHWHPVTETISGQPLSNPLYHVHAATTEAGPFVEIGNSDSTGFVHVGAVGGPTRYFYRVSASAQ